MKKSKKLIFTNNDLRSDSNLALRVKFFRRICVIGIIVSGIFLVTIDGRRGPVQSLYIDIVIIATLGALFFLSHRVKTYAILFNIVMLLLVSGITIGLLSDGVLQSVIFVALVPIVGYLLLRRIGGIAWTVLIVLIQLALALGSSQGIIAVQAKAETFIYAAVSCLLISLILYVYENINKKNEELLAVQANEIMDANISLSDELANDKKNTEDLQAALENAEKSNKQLKATKLAILNVLDDTNALQKQLRTEKENVELKVEERTEQLRTEQARVRASINSIDSGLLITFVGESKVTYNPALLTIFALGPNFIKAAEESTTEAIKILQDSIGEGFDIKHTVEECMKHGKSFNASDIAAGNKFIRISGAPVMDKTDKTTLGTVFLVQDMTEAKLFERTKDEFLSIASHELRTPLTAIRGNASMLEMLYGDKMPNDDARLMLSDIKDSTVRLISIVNQFLTTSRLEQKRTIFEKKPVDIAKSIRYCASELQGMVDEKKLKLTINLPKELPYVLADETRTQEVIVNLIGNAIKYTDKGSIMITAQTIADSVQVDFTDTGKGIDPKNHDLLFRKFQQASADILTRDDSRSTGLGLYITKQLVEQMGGTIYLSKSALGKGSTFTFTLPVVVTEMSHKVKAKAKG